MYLVNKCFYYLIYEYIYEFDDFDKVLNIKMIIIFGGFIGVIYL